MPIAILRLSLVQVLCSIPQPEKNLAHVYKLLKPDGQLLLVGFAHASQSARLTFETVRTRRFRRQAHKHPPASLQPDLDDTFGRMQREPCLCKNCRIDRCMETSSSAKTQRHKWGGLLSTYCRPFRKSLMGGMQCNAVTFK